MARIILWICAVVVAAGLTAASPPQGQASEQTNQASQPQQDAAQNPPPPKADDPERLYAACQNGETNRNSDLCAQWYAADSAYEASVWTRRTGWFTAIGLIVGAVTMAAAIGAALFARDAATHAETGALVAEAGLAHSKEISAAEIRPWVTFELAFRPAKFDTNGNLEVHVDVTLRNIGRVPALDVELRFGKFFTDISVNGSVNDAEIEAYFREPHPPLKSSVGLLPNGTHKRTFVLPYLKETFTFIGATSIAPVMALRADYTWGRRDIIGRTGRSFALHQTFEGAPEKCLIFIRPELEPFEIKVDDGGLSYLT